MVAAEGDNAVFGFLSRAFRRRQGGVDVGGTDSQLPQGSVGLLVLHLPTFVLHEADPRPREREMGGHGEVGARPLAAQQTVEEVASPVPEVLVETPVEDGVDGAVGEHQEHRREVDRLVPRRQLQQGRIGSWRITGFSQRERKRKAYTGSHKRDKIDSDISRPP